MLNDFLEARWYGNSARTWFTALAIVLGGIVVARLFYFISTKGVKRLAEKARGRLLYLIVDMVEEPLSLVIITASCFLGAAHARLPGLRRRLHHQGRIGHGHPHRDLGRRPPRRQPDHRIPPPPRPEERIDPGRPAHPYPPQGREHAHLIAGAVSAAKHVGYDLGAVVAGLGIGGLAFAFAAQDTIGNLFGGIAVFVDAPFRMGDRVKIAGFEGWVRDIGLRTSKLETLDGRRLTIPNSTFSKSVIENVSSEPATKVVQTIASTAATTRPRWRRPSGSSRASSRKTRTWRRIPPPSSTTSASARTT
jgi:MscS family membrane protein